MSATGPPQAKPTLRAGTNIGFAVAIAVLAATGLASLWAAEQVRTARERQHQSQVRQSELLRLLNILTDAETGQRGFLVTGRAEFLQPYEAARTGLRDQLARIRRAYAAVPAPDRVTLGSLESLASAKLAWVTAAIEVRRSSGAAAAAELLGTGRGKLLMDSVRLEVQRLGAAEDSAAAAWEASADRASRWSASANGLVTVLAIAFLLAALWVVNRDITRREASERDLRESERRLFQILEALPVAVFVTDAAGRPYYANRASHALLGVDLTTFPLERIKDEFPTVLAGTDEPFPAERWPLADALAGRSAHVSDLEIVRSAGRTAIEIWGTPVLDADGRVAYAIAVTSDISERRAAQEAIRRAAEAAQVASRAKSDFLARMSHELRTPLNSIIGFSEVLEDRTFGELNPKQERYVRNVLTSGRQLLQLVNDVLDLSKIEAGRVELALAPMDVAATLAEVRASLGPQADEKRHALTLAVEKDLPPLVADVIRFRQIVSNLLSNAIKYTPPGGRIRVEARAAGAAAPGPGGWLELAVADTGIGISPEDQERIFADFEQVDSAYVRAQQGTGLGLALTRKLVAMHDGRIGVTSEPGQGSRFQVLLPRLGVVPAVAPVSAAATSGPGVSASAPLVLVVDDEATAADLITHYLQSAGYRVVVAATGDAALALARSLMPDVITLDILLPDHDGLEVLARLKSDPATSGIPVIVVSITEDQALGFGIGAAEWFVKPVDREALVAAVRRITRANGIGATALVVDDDPAAVELLKDHLEADGHHVLTAAGGRDGIQLARSARPDVIVLDLLMPDVNGFDVVEALRADPATAAIPILICTAKDLDDADRERLRDSVQAILAKDGVPVPLLAEIGRWCPPPERAER